jgi:hypothetical protein
MVKRARHLKAALHRLLASAVLLTMRLKTATALQHPKLETGLLNAALVLGQVLEQLPELALGKARRDRTSARELLNLA